MEPSDTNTNTNTNTNTDTSNDDKNDIENNNNTTESGGDTNPIQSDTITITTQPPIQTTPTQSNNNETETTQNDQNDQNDNIPTNTDTETTQNTQLTPPDTQNTEPIEQNTSKTPPVPTTTPIIPPILPNPMIIPGINSINSINGMLASMSTLPGLNPSTIMPGLPTMPTMPGFPPYPMFATPTMLPFMPNPTLTPTTNKTKTGKRCGDWQAYITEKGKTYYFNVATKVNTWNKPNEWIEHENNTKSIDNNTQDHNHNHKESVNESKKKQYLGTKATKQLAVIRDTVAKRSFGNPSKAKYKDRSERVIVFRSLLVDKKIDADWNWKKVLHKIVSDPRYNALTKLDDKKNELVLWQQDEKKRMKEEEREKRHKLKSGFFALLDENIEKIVRKEYRKAKHYLESDDRYSAILKKHRREEWFEEWQENAYKQYKKKRKKEKENAIKQFTTHLRASNLVSIGVSYSEIRDKLDFLDAPFMVELSDRNQNKIYDDIYNELREKEKQEKKLKMKLERNNFNDLLDELISKRVLHCKCKFSDKNVMILMCEDERYKTIKNGVQSHKISDLFMEKLDILKYELSKDKKIFKSFIKLNENDMFNIDINDDLQSVLPKFKALMSGKTGDILSVSMDHIELLLLEYISKKQKIINNSKEFEIDNNLIKQENIKFNIKTNGNAKKRLASDIIEENESAQEPQRKRQKIDQYVEVTIHDPNTNINPCKTEVMDEGEIEELEEGELSDAENDKKDDGQIMEEKVDNDGDGMKGHSRSRSRSRSRGDSEDSYDNDSDGDGRHRKKRRNKKSKYKGKNFKLRHHHKRHRKRSRENINKEKKDIDNIGLLYGMTSDFDEDDLYYRGDVKRGHDDDGGVYGDDAGRGDNGLKRRRNHRGHRSGGSGHWRGGGGGGRSRRGHYSHHDLDYGYGHLENENEINADSYNLDKHQMARWNTGH